MCWTRDTLWRMHDEKEKTIYNELANTQYTLDCVYAGARDRAQRPFQFVYGIALVSAD